MSVSSLSALSDFGGADVSPMPFAHTIKRVAVALRLHSVLMRAERMTRRGLWGRAPIIHDESVPIPPYELILRSIGRGDSGWFLESGRKSSLEVAAAVYASAEKGRTPIRVLDFGSGCGRVTRHLVADKMMNVTACDLDREAIQWIREHLDVTDAYVNTRLPPLPDEDESHDVITAFSVFTHMAERSQRAWLGEFERVLSPGGLLVMTVHGLRATERLPARQKAEFTAGNLVVLHEQAEYQNWCCSYHPPTFVEDWVSASFEILSHEIGGASGNPPQDLWVLRKPVSS